MEKAYWISRKKALLKVAENAENAEAKLAHYDLAGRYSVKAASEIRTPTAWADSLPPPIYAAKYPGSDSGFDQ